MTRKLSKLLIGMMFAVFAATTWSATSSAVVIGPGLPCGSCFGVKYTIDLAAPVAFDLNFNIQTVTFEADTSGTTLGSDVWLGSLGIQLYASQPEAVTLVSHTAIGTWVEALGKIGGAGGSCADDSTGAFCAETTSMLNLVGTATYQWRKRRPAD